MKAIHENMFALAMVFLDRSGYKSSFFSLFDEQK